MLNRLSEKWNDNQKYFKNNSDINFYKWGNQKQTNKYEIYSNNIIINKILNKLIFIIFLFFSIVQVYNLYSISYNCWIILK
jgi:hypothetical protein